MAKHKDSKADEVPAAPPSPSSAANTSKIKGKAKKGKADERPAHLRPALPANAGEVNLDAENELAPAIGRSKEADTTGPGSEDEEDTRE